LVIKCSQRAHAVATLSKANKMGMKRRMVHDIIISGHFFRSRSWGIGLCEGAVKACCSLFMAATSIMAAPAHICLLPVSLTASHDLYCLCNLQAPSEPGTPTAHVITTSLTTTLPRTIQVRGCSQPSDYGLGRPCIPHSPGCWIN